MTNETLVIPTLVVINVYRCLQKLWITRSASLFTLLFLNRRFWFERSYLSHALITGLHGFWQCHDVTETICLPWIIGSIDRWTLGDVRTRLTICSFNARRRIVFVFLLTSPKAFFSQLSWQTPRCFLTSRIFNWFCFCDSISINDKNHFCLTPF